MARRGIRPGQRYALGRARGWRLHAAAVRRQADGRRCPPRAWPPALTPGWPPPPENYARLPKTHHQLLPSGLALRARLQARPSQPTTLRAVPGGSGHFAARQLASQPLEFVAMLVPHVMLRYEVNIRLYGAISTTRRLKLGWLENPPTGGPPPQGNFESACIPSRQHPFPLVSQPPKPTPIKQDDSQGDPQSEFLRNRKRNWAKLIAKVYQEDPSLCKTCGQPMEIIAAISSPAQDDVIEKVLRHLNLWDPPWRRERRARGPPTSHPQQTPFLQGALDDFDGIDPQINTEDYCIDPPFPDEP